MTENNIKSVVFPAMNVAGEAKTKGLVEKIADYMGIGAVQFETVIVMKVNFPNTRPDFETIVKRLAGNKTGLLQVGRTVAPEATKKTSEEPST